MPSLPHANLVPLASALALLPLSAPHAPLTRLQKSLAPKLAIHVAQDQYLLPERPGAMLHAFTHRPVLPSRTT
jgi:hypothetical protein